MISNPKSKTTKELGFIPDKDWPGAFGIYKFSKAVVSYNLQPFLFLIICAYIADIAETFSKTSLLSFLLFVVLYLFEISSIVLLVNSMRGKKLSVSEALDKGTRLSIKIILLYMLIFIGIVISVLLLIVPVLFVLPRLILAPYYLIDQDMSITESLKTAWADGEGHALKTWGVIGVQVLFGLLSIIIIGIYFTIVYSAAFIVLYGYINSQKAAAKK